MGLHFKDLMVKKEIAIKDLRGKVLAVDAYNMLYQFLTTIRQMDGSALTDSKGRVTSHLIGLFSRTTALMEEGLKLVFVFDGQPPTLKQKTWEKRSEIKKEATLKLKEAEESGNLEEMKKYSSRTAILTKSMVADAQAVIAALGLPIVQAPSEGEAQASHLVKNGDAYAVISQDYDTLMFGCPLLVRNLSIAGKRKRTGKLAYTTIKPELISLKEILQELHLSQEQLIVLAILVGTDYNPKGILGIGPKKGLKLVREHGTDFAGLFTQLAWEQQYPDLPWQEIFRIIKNIPVTDDYVLEWKPIEEQKLFALLVREYEFGEERVRNKIEVLKATQGERAQQGLNRFFL